LLCVVITAHYEDETITGMPAAEMNAVEKRTGANLRETKAEIRNNREEMRTDQAEMTARLEDKIEANNGKFEVLLGTVISRMEIRQARTEADHQEMMPRWMPG
jgi:hypothetical protein